MSKLTRKQNKLHKAQARYEKVSKRKKQFQIEFERIQNKKGKFKTNANVVRREKQYHGNNRGLLHKVVNLKYRVNGDAPSITRVINDSKPKTFKGKALRKSTQIVNFAVHDATNTVLHIGLAAETVSLKSHDIAVREVVNKAREKYTREAIDDYHRGAFEMLKLSKDAVVGTKNHFKQKKQYKLEKAKFKLKKAERSVFLDERFKPEIKLNNRKRKAKRGEYRSFKKDFKKSRNINKSELKDRKRNFKIEKKELDLKNRRLKKENSFKKASISNQKKIVQNSAPDILALKPVNYTAKRLRASSWQKAVNEDTDNDFMHVIDSTKRRVADPIIQKTSKSEKLQRQQKQYNKLEDKNAKSNKKLNKQENKLNQKKNAPKKKPKGNTKKSFGEKLREIFKYVKNVYAAEVKRFFACIAVPILITLLVFAFILMIFSSIFSGGGFTLGTYTAQDYDLSQAEKYYTKLAWDLNEKILMVSDENNWKNGLAKFGANKRNLKDKPDYWYWGMSDVYEWQPNYDFDVYKLWAFLCAYYYDFSTDNGDIKYWKYSSDTEKLLDEIFNAEYEFVYWYDNTSRWDELSNYVYFGGGDAETGTYNKCEKEAYIYDDQPYRYRFKPVAYTSELSQYFDSEGYVCIDSNYRVLNPNDDYEVTGYYIMDNRYYSGTKEPFYYIDNNTNTYFFMHSGERYDRSFWGWNGIDAWFLISPTDTNIWNHTITNYCLYGYYQKYEWKTDCRLYYSVKQKKTFDKVIEDKLKSMSNADERIEYYNLLIGTDSGTMYGNHQTIKSLTGTSIHDSSFTNGFGWDMQNWNTRHCSIDDLHEAVDIKVSSETTIYAPFDCEIKSYNEDDKTLVLRKDDVQYWYDGNGGTKRDTEVTIKNVKLKSGYAEDDTLKEGEAFAITTNSYIHVKVKIDTDGYGWDFVDPKLVFY